MSNDPAVSSPLTPDSIGELIIKGVTQGPLRRYGPEGHPGQEEFERVIKTLRRADPDDCEPATPPPTYPLKPYTGPIEIAPAGEYPEGPAFTFEGDIVFAGIPSKPRADEQGPGLIEIKPKEVS